MIRVMYRWTIKLGREDEFIRNWEAGTRRIRETFAGSFGSMMLRSAKNREHFYGVRRWESRAARDAAGVGAHFRSAASLFSTAAGMAPHYGIAPGPGVFKGINKKAKIGSLPRIDVT